MRTKKVTRYYCDHCSKGMLKGDSMIRHESICFANPKRSCYLCENAMSDTGEFAKAFALKYEILKSDRTEPYEDTSSITREQTDEIRKAVNDCPACILSVLKQSGAFAFEHFNYKKEKDAYLAEKHRESLGYAGMGL